MSGLSLAPQVLGDERAPEVSRRVGSPRFPSGAGRNRPLLRQEDGPGRRPAGVCPWKVAGALGAAAFFPERNLCQPPLIMSLQEKVQLLFECVGGFLSDQRALKNGGKTQQSCVRFPSFSAGGCGVSCY